MLAPPPPIPELAWADSDGKPFTTTVKGKYDAATDSVSLSLPELGGTGRVAVAMALNGVDFVDAPSPFTIYGHLNLAAISPTVGLAGGGATVELRGVGLRPSSELSALFVKGSKRQVVAATYDAAKGCATCVAPAWPLSAPATGDDADPNEGDVIVEVSLNAQQWTTSCKHYKYIEVSVEAVEPPTAALAGGAELKLTCSGVVDTGSLKVKFSRSEPDEVVYADATLDDEPITLTTAPDEEGNTTEYTRQRVTVVAPAFENAAEPFDATVQLSVDGGQFIEPGLAFKYEGGGKKK